MDSTSRKEHHIINVLGWCGGEEKCRMSPPDREKTLRLFISGHFTTNCICSICIRCAAESSARGKRSGMEGAAPSLPPLPLLPISSLPHQPQVPPPPSISATWSNRAQEPAGLYHCSGVPPSLAMPNSSHRATNGTTYPATTYPATQDRSLKDVWRLSVVAGHRIPTSSTARASLPQGQPLGATLPPIPRLQPLPYL